MMRLSLLLGFALALVAPAIQAGTLPDTFHEEARVIRNTCTQETGANWSMDDLLGKQVTGSFSDDKFKCYLKCVFEKFKLIDGDNIHFGELLGMVPPSLKEAASKAIDNCRAETGTDLCDKVYNFNKCIQNLAHEKFLVIY